MKAAQTPLQQAIVAARIARAKRLVEHAQHALTEACQQLSVLNGGFTAYKRVGTLSDRCHAEWYRLDELEKRRTRIGLDHEPSDFDRRDFPELFAAHEAAE